MMFPYDFGFQVQMPWNVVGDLSMGCLTISSPQPCHLGLKHMRNKQDHPPILGKKKVKVIEMNSLKHIETTNLPPRIVSFEEINPNFKV